MKKAPPKAGPKACKQSSQQQNNTPTRSRANAPQDRLRRLGEQSERELLNRWDEILEGLSDGGVGA